MPSPLQLRPDYDEGEAAVPRGEGCSRAASRVADSWLLRFSHDSLVRIGGMETTQSPLDGLRKQKVLNTLNRLLEPHTRGLHRDNVWAPIQAIRESFEHENIPATQMPGSGKYEREEGRDVRKVWLYVVPFTNQNGRPDNAYVRIVASGSGPVDDPLAVYDVVAYAT